MQVNGLDGRSLGGPRRIAGSGPAAPAQDPNGQAEQMVQSGQALAAQVDGDQVVVYQPSQSGLESTVLSSGRTGGTRPGFLTRLVMPESYPENVHPDYVPYRKWQFVREVAAGITSFYATEAVVGSMGFGAVGPLSAARTWMIRDAVDGIGKAGASLVAHKADTDPRRWTVSGELIQGAGTLLETALLAIPQSFPITAPLANILKAAGNGTKNAASASIEKHQALGNNLGDLRSKNGNQSMIASALGAGLAVGLKTLGERLIGPAAVPVIAALMTGIALVAQKKSVDALQLNDLTDASLSEMVRGWVSAGQVPGPEPGHGLKDMFLGAGRIFRNNCDVEFGAPIQPLLSDPAHFDRLRNWYAGRNYLLDFDGDDNVRVVFNPEAQPRDLVCAWVQVQLLDALRRGKTFKEVERTRGKAAGAEWAVTTSLRATPDNPQAFLEALQDLGWETDRVLLKPRSPRATWKAGQGGPGASLSMAEFRKQGGLED